MALTTMPIIDGVVYIKTLVDAMDQAGIDSLTWAANLINQLRPVILLSFMLYIMLWGWAMVRGMIAEPIHDGVSRILKLAIIMGLVLGTGMASGPAGQDLYIKYVYDFFWHGPEQLFQIVTGHGTNTIVIVTQAVSFIYTLAFDYLQEGVKLGTDQVDLIMFGLGSITILAGTMLAATIITTIVFAKFMLAILLAVGPIFLVLFLFDGTRRLFEAWLGQLISNVVLLLIFGLAVNLVMGVLWSVVKAEFLAYLTERVLTTVISIGADLLGLGSSSAIAPSPVKGLGIVMVCVVCQQFLAKVPAVADSIGRSLSMNLQTGLARK